MRAYAGILLNGSKGHKIIGNEMSYGSAGIILEKLKDGDTVIHENEVSHMIASGIYMESEPYFTGDNSIDNVWGEDVGGWGTRNFIYHIIVAVALVIIIGLLSLLFLSRKKRKAA